MTIHALPDPSAVDECTVTGEGKVRLVAYTRVPLEDADEIRQAVLAKLTTYLDYVESTSFRDTYGAEKPVEIVFRCVAEPAQPVLSAALELGTAWYARTGVNVPIYWTWHEQPST